MFGKILRFFFTRHEKYNEGYTKFVFQVYAGVIVKNRFFQLDTVTDAERTDMHLLFLQNKPFDAAAVKLFATFVKIATFVSRNTLAKTSKHDILFPQQT